MGSLLIHRWEAEVSEQTEKESGATKNKNKIAHVQKQRWVFVGLIHGSEKATTI